MHQRTSPRAKTRHVDDIRSTPMEVVSHTSAGVDNHAALDFRQTEFFRTLSARELDGLKPCHDVGRRLRALAIWKDDYNTVSPHSGTIGNLSPVVYAISV
jgi:hypothetical protein